MLIFGQVKNEFLGVKTQGDTLVTTLDSGLQDFVIDNLMENRLNYCGGAIYWKDFGYGFFA